MPDGPTPGTPGPGGGATGRQPGVREALLVAAIALAIVVGLELLSAAVPGVRDAFRGLPITIAVLVVGTVAVLLVIAVRRPRA